MTVICLKYMSLGTGGSELNDASLPSVYGTFPPVNYAPTDAYVYGQLHGIDNALGAIKGGSLALTGVVNPNGVVTAVFAGRTYINTANLTQWISVDGTNTGWKQQVNPALTGLVSPVGVVTPRHVGDVYVNTALSHVWLAYGTLSTDWVNTSNAESIKTGAVAPTAVVPDFVGQRYVDTVAKQVWVAGGLAATDWQPIFRRTTDGGSGLADGADNIAAGHVQTVTVGSFGGQFGLSSTNGLHGSGAPYGVDADYASMLGGVDHYINKAPFGVILGGFNNRMAPSSNMSGSAIVGGHGNINKGQYSVILGGQDNQVAEGVEFAIAGGLLVILEQEGGIALGYGSAMYQGGDPITNVHSVVLGESATAYGPRNFALGGSTWNDRSIAIGSANAHSTGRIAVAIGNTDGVSSYQTEASGDHSMAVGSGAQAHGFYSLAFGKSALVGSVPAKTVSLANVGPNLEITVAGEDLTSRIVVTDPLVLFDLSGGGHSKTLHPNAYVGLSVDGIVFGGVDTVITVLGLNLPAATAGRIVFPAQSVHAMSFGDGAIVNTGSHYALAFGEQAQVESEGGLGFGYQSFGGDSSVPGQISAIAIGYRAKALNSYALALGRDAQSRNQGELVHSAFQFGGISWAQMRNVILGRQIAIAGGLSALYTDAVDAGTEEIATFAGHHYGVFGIIQAVYSTGGTARVTAQWFVQFAAKNVAGVVTILGAPILTLINNEDAVNILPPVISAVGATIRIEGDDEQSGTYGITWLANLFLSESGL